MSESIWKVRAWGTASSPGIATAANTLELAHAYARGGLSVIPIRPDRSKAPDAAVLPHGKWGLFQTRIADDSDLDEWFADGTRGLAVVGGRVSGGYEVIDFDAIDLFGPWCDLVRDTQPGLLERLTVVRTPRPGMHVSYRCSAAGGNQKLASGPDAAGKVKALIETKGEGGYVLAPGCPPECHETGRLYQHYAGPPLAEVGVVTPEERDVLIAAAQTFDDSAEPAHEWDSSGTTERNGSLRPGDDFSARASWEEVLGGGWFRVKESGGLALWRRPGKDGHCWSATTGFRGRMKKDLLYVFSSSCHPLQPGKSYSKFSAYATIRHGGDFGAAAAELKRMGYGGTGHERNGKHEANGHGGNGHAAPKTDQQQLCVSIDGEVLAEGSFDEVMPPADRDDSLTRSIQMLTMGAILDATYPEPKWVVKGLLSEGLNILAGAPKQGKSMLALNLALTVAGGGRALGREAVAAADVLYLSLEDKERRVQFRARKMLSAMDGALLQSTRQRLTIATDWPRQNEGGLRLLDHWRKRCGNPTLIIIDVWNRFCPHQQKGSAYAQDADHMGEVKRWGDKRGVTMLILHHTRKPGPSKDIGDYVNEVSGTLGLAGTADGILVLLRHRQDVQANLHVTGRDVIEQELVIEFDPNTFSWKSLGSAKDHIEGRVQKAVVSYLRGLGGVSAFVKDIADAINEQPDSVRQAVNRLGRDRIVKKVGNAWAFPGEVAYHDATDGDEHRPYTDV